MATTVSQQKRLDHGVIILGNSGVGKSFLCNVLMDRDRFETDYRPNAVTKKTELGTITVHGVDLTVFNVPGLIENDQKSIEHNKEEIMLAFRKCPYSIVIFVWTPNAGGRVQPDDAIAFAALYQAYQFPPQSLVYIFNNLEPNRHQRFDPEFLVQVKKALEQENLDIDPRAAAFIEKINFGDDVNRGNVRSQLIELIWQHHPTVQKQQSDINLRSEALKKQREEMKRLQAQLAADRENYERQVREMARKIEENDARRKTNAFDNTIRAASTIVAVPVGAVTGVVRGVVSGFSEGARAVVDPLADYIDDSSNPGVLRVGAVPAAVVVGAVVGVGGALVGAATGVFKGIGDAIDSVWD